MTPLREHRKVTVKVECRSRSQHVTWGRMNEKVQVAFSSAHYYAPTPILHSIHLSWHLCTFILFVGLSWSILFLSHICTRIWIFHIIIFFFVLIFVSFLNCSILVYRIFVFVEFFEVPLLYFCLLCSGKEGCWLPINHWQSVISNLLLILIITDTIVNKRKLCL